MKSVWLTEQDRGVFRIAAANTAVKSREDLRRWGKAADRVGLDDVPEGLLEQLSDSDPREYLLEDAEYEELKKVLDAMPQWPRALHRVVCHCEDHLGAAKDVKVEKGQKA